MKKILLLALIAVFFLLSQLSAKEVVIEDFENIKQFSNYTAERATMQLSSVEGYKGKALRIDFDLVKDHFVAISKPQTINLDEIYEFSWQMKGNANAVMLEVKFIYSDGSVFGKKIPLIALETNNWKKFKFSAKEIHYWWGGDNKMDKIEKSDIALSRGDAKKGYIVIDEFSYAKIGQEDLSCNIDLNQVGYHPTDKKIFIARIHGFNDNKNITGEFTIIDSLKKVAVFSGKLTNTHFIDWYGVFLKGDFSGLLTPGKYSAKITLNTYKGIVEKKSYPFIIADSVLSKITLKPQLTYLNYQKCGINCHKKDPVMGGWHDTLFDIGKRMWTTPILVYGISCYVNDGTIHPNFGKDGIASDADELVWGAKFLVEMADSQGALSWHGIYSDFANYMTESEFLTRSLKLKPEDDNLPRIKATYRSFHATCFGMVALLNSMPTLKYKDKELADKAKKTVLKAWEWINKQSLYESYDYGAYLWIATELYKYTGDKKYMDRVDRILPELLKLQALNFNNFERNACGNFYTSNTQKDFLYQYKYVIGNICVNLALINLAEIFQPGNPLWFDAYYANYVFGENFLKGIASKTPYGQAGVGLEQEDGVLKGSNNKFKIMYFSGMGESEKRSAGHGLNCDHMAMAYVSMRWGRVIDDLELEEFADNQINWVLGANPFGYCMLMGVGTVNPYIMTDYVGKPKVSGIIANGIWSADGKNPKWHGDSPRSGEDWLPSNAAYLAAISLADSPAFLSGKVLSKGNPVVEAKIEISGQKEILTSSHDGTFGPVRLTPQKKYMITVTADGKIITKKVALLSGANKNIILDFERNFDISIIPPKKIVGKRNCSFTIRLSKNAVEKEYKIMVKGADLKSPAEGNIKSPSLDIKLKPDGDKPLMLVFLIKGNPVVYKTYYLKVF